MEELSEEPLSVETELKLNQSSPTGHLLNLALTDVSLNSSAIWPFVNVLFPAGIDFERTGIGKDLKWSQTKDSSITGLAVCTPLAIISFLMAIQMFRNKRSYFKNNLSCLFSKSNKGNSSNSHPASKVNANNPGINS